MPTEFAERVETYFSGMGDALARIPVDVIEQVFRILCVACRDDRQMFLMGNGGSAALASHFAVDLCKGTSVAGRRRFRVFSIVDNIPVVTAYANDVSYADIFSEQIRGCVKACDVVFAISTSGNSPNIVNALKAARAVGAVTVVLTGFEGGEAKDLADTALIVPADDVQQIEDCHLVVTHLLMQAMREFVRDEMPVDTGLEKSV